MIRTVLVANRGEIARRVFRTCRAMGIRTVAVFSDADVGAPHVGDADLAVHIGPAAASESYLDIERILDAARRTGAEAIHPGYGFLAENARFADACTDAGITFIGPSSHAISAMGSKLESKRLMIEAGVPTLPSVEIAPGEDGSANASDIGYPLLVKASAGGGGKGMRIVAEPRELNDAVAGAIREAESAFGDGTVFLERYLTDPRHIEVQIVGDTHGNIVSLLERECSIQRRHQKVIEECPSPVVDAELRRRLCDTAVAAAATVGYVGAGTVEFLLDSNGEFYFLEMNTRLQVEHPVTELVTGVDLVRLQIEIAEGAELDVDHYAGIEPSGHAIEARLYAEDPANDYLPSTGTIEVFEFSAPVRVDQGVESGSEVSIHYDPLLAKVVAHAETRTDAGRLLGSALRSARVHGVTTNLGLLVGLLEHERFLSAEIHTGFLDSIDPGALSASVASDPDINLMALAASVIGQHRRRMAAPVQRTLPSGFRNNPSQLNTDAFSTGDRTVTVGYRMGGGFVDYSIDGDTLERATLIVDDAQRVRLGSHGAERLYSVVVRGDRFFVDTSSGGIALTRLPRLPIPQSAPAAGSLLSPMPGRVVRVEAVAGAAVEAGQPLVIIEAMKMEHTIAAPHAGIVMEVPVKSGDQVMAEQVVAIVESA